MIKFDSIEYIRPNYDSIKSEVEELINKLISANSFDEYKDIVIKINDIQKNIEQLYDYADIINMRHLNDEYYKDEIDYWNEYKPKYDVLFNPFYKELNNSKYKELLLPLMSSNFFNIIEGEERLTSDDVVDLVAKENKLKCEYRDLNKTKILYDGEEQTISTISKLYSDKNRDIRKKAHDAINDFYLEHQDEYNEILYNLIQVRNEIARQYDLDNYVEYSLIKRKRFGYDYKDISKFRDYVVKYILPICKQIIEWQEEELGIDEIKYYDSVFFEEMPKLKYTSEELLNKMKESFNIDDDLANFFNDMLDNGYIDYLNREDKVNFSITNYLTELGVPVVTGQYKDTYYDVTSTCHEMGHAYQKYNASIQDKDHIVSPLLKYPNLEIAEMFSYSMELIIMKYVDSIFSDEDYKKYCFMEIHKLVSVLPYVCLVDEFQEKIYSNDRLNKEDINKTWLELVHKYGLEVSNSGHPNLDNGNYFFRQSHVYADPFYYIDYALSYFGAIAIWSSCDESLDKFKEMAGVASYYSFKDLMDKYDLPNPFDEESVKNISLKLTEELHKYRAKK